MIKKINHVAIAAQDAGPLEELFTSVFGFQKEDPQTDDEQGITTRRVVSDGAAVELIEPNHDKSTISGFLKRQGQGIHHLSLEVENLEDVLQLMKQKNVQLINETPMQVGNYRVAFLHPKSTEGLLIELIETAA